MLSGYQAILHGNEGPYFVDGRQVGSIEKTGRIEIFADRYRCRAFDGEPLSEHHSLAQALAAAREHWR